VKVQANASTMVTMVDCFNMVFHLTPTYPFYQGAFDTKARHAEEAYWTKASFKVL
jgi:hypothetical protein